MTSNFTLTRSYQSWTFKLEEPVALNDSGGRACMVTHVTVERHEDGYENVRLTGHSLTKAGAKRSSTQTIFAHEPRAKELELDATMAVRRIELAAQA